MQKTTIVILLLTALLLTACSPDAGLETPFRFLHKDVILTPGASAEPIIESLGKPNSYTEEASCAFDGLDKTYVYSGFSFTTYPDKGADYIHTIWFTDDSAVTEEGIYIGASQQAVDDAYGAEHWNGVNAYILTREKMRLTVLLTDGFVSSVKYEAVF